MANTVDHTHGDNGDKPAQDLNFQSKDFPDPEVFDWFWSEVPAAINDHAALLEAIDRNEDGVVNEAEVAQSADTYKENDIDRDGDGKVNAAETADTANSVSGSDVDGKVTAAATADTANSVSGSDVDGQVASAAQADVSDETKGIETRTSDPSNPSDGRVWIRTDL